MHWAMKSQSLSKRSRLHEPIGYTRFASNSGRLPVP